jgi:hypothetical protein
MLKIRDEINLKELEKFGFEYFENGNYKAYQKGELFRQFMCVELDRRKLYIYTADDMGIDENTLYDLIKADLVEKVEEVSNE